MSNASVVTGVVGISSAESARHALFYSSLTNVSKPAGTALAHAIGSSISKNRNSITAQALAAGAEWIWYVDDDQIFSADALLKLLARNVSIVSGLYLQRKAPYIPHIYDREELDGAVHAQCLEPGESGLKSVLATGAGCLLVRTAVLKQMEPPYWRLGQIGGQRGSDEWGDDIDFCRRARAKGFTIWCDLDVPVGHFMTGLVCPGQDTDGLWRTALMESDGTPIISFPAPTGPMLQSVDMLGTVELPPGWLTLEEAKELQTLATNQQVLELGSYKGRSTVVMATTAKLVVSIDWHQGDIHIGSTDTRDEFKQNTKDFSNIIPIIGRFADVVPQLKDYQFDGVFVDGQHDFKSVQDDMKLALSLKPKWIAVHDWGLFAVQPAIEEMGLTPTRIVGTLAIFDM